ncbi:histidine ammonia-lyase [Spiractinospora alimapuensis]|uniref:histidine ammonia-lyase n=1 Tax=Spiractinospora alimapuensis TaxID=2820884 RepID=UPI001EEA3FAD|nr:histidine ammonia-lyase [Spiractinospora alimapuensis]QVQ51851.1 histidine ammonia-lyase [Spiractinospora alimapuensis]
MNSPSKVALGRGPLTLNDVVAVARDGVAVVITDEARQDVADGRARVRRLAEESEPAYGVSTGFGALATRHIEPDLRARLQRSLIRSHAAGSGTEVEREVVRALMLLRLRTLASGGTGVRMETADALAGMLNAGITPVVYEYGSLGCSGDLAPLSHVALALMGEGEVDDASGTRVDAAKALASAGLLPLELAAKEGLALINGTDGMLGMLVLACHDLGRLLRVADVTAAMSVEALLGTDRAYAAELQALRPHPGQAAAAANMRAMLSGSAITASHQGCGRVQDAYSLRCAPQVAGAARDTLAHATDVAARELVAVIDNPVVLPDGRVESNGNFHGAPVGYVLDFLAIAAADVASIAERRTDRMLDVARSQGLPAFLAEDPGVDSGHMIAQYTQAAIVSELKRLAAPASVDSIPSSAMQEDHVSMGWAAARKLRRAVDGLTRVLAVELLTAARALDLRSPLSPAPATAAVRDAVRQRIPGPGPDRYLAPDIAAGANLITDGSVLAAAESVVPLA